MIGEILLKIKPKPIAMKKLILIAVLLLTTSQITFAQQAIAKIKFEEAEEAYAAKDYQITIDKLDEVEAILKVTNPKVMYLRIMGQYQLIIVHCYLYHYLLDNTRTLCSKYLKDYENIPDNDDKYRDVYKASEALGATPMKERYDKMFKSYTEDPYLKNQPSSSFVLGMAYSWGLGVEKNLETTFKYQTKGAEKGYVQSQFELGRYYLNGWGTGKDITQAKFWFQKAADQGHKLAKVELEKLNNTVEK